LNILEAAKQVILEAPLCESCLGRCFARLGSGLSNRERGVLLKKTLLMEAERLKAEGYEEGVMLLKALAKSGVKKILSQAKVEETEIEPCYVCEGVMDRVQELASAIEEMLSPYEYGSFLVGTRVPGVFIEREDTIRAKFSLSYGESLKSDLNRELRKILSQRLKRKVDFSNPDIVAILDVRTGQVEVKPSPVFIYGRYLKLRPGIPQNKWFCSKCWGKGCEYCSWTGKMYLTSIEELVAQPLVEIFQGKDVKFHGAGREDVDVKVLGKGRPFIVEVREPKRRRLDLSWVEREINRRAEGLVEVRELRYSSREEVRKIKITSQVREKTYLMKLRVEGGIKEEEAKKLEEELTGSIVKQRTPLRVLHRRADKVRMKKIYEVKIKEIAGDTVTMLITSQGGLYVKELATGDEGRTTPSVSELLGKKVEVEELIVLDVE